MKNKLFNTNKIPQAMIIRQAPLSNFDDCLKDILKGIICPQHGCNECIWCKKINAGTYYDLIVFEGKEMKKQDVLDLINRYSRSGLESANVRAYVIKNIEYASKAILNSLLKFVEEPPQGVYAIFTTRNYNAIIPTIRSRCFSVYLPADESSINNFLQNKSISLSDQQLIKKCFYDLENMKLNFDKFIEYNQLITNLVQPIRLMFANEGLNLFRKMEYTDINLFLEICKNKYPQIAHRVIALQDNLYLNSPKALIYNEIYTSLEEVGR